MSIGKPAAKRQIPFESLYNGEAGTRIESCREDCNDSSNLQAAGEQDNNKAQAGAHNSLHLKAGGVERNPGPTQPCYACSGATTSKGLKCVKCGARCHKKYSRLTRYEAAQ